MNKDAIYRIQHALDLLTEGLRLTAQELADISPHNHDLKRIAAIQRRTEEAQTTIDTLDSFL